MLKRNRGFMDSGVAAFGCSAVCILLIAFFTSFSLVTADDGEEVVLVSKPYLTDGGTFPEPVANGSKWRVFTTDEYSYDVRPKAYAVVLPDSVTSNKNVIDIEVTAIISIERGKSPVLHGTGGPNWYKAQIEPEFISRTRAFVMANTLDDLNTNVALLRKGEEQLRDGLKLHAGNLGLPIVVERVTINKVTPPPQLIEQLSETAAQTERQNTENARVGAESARESAERAKGAADMAYRDKLGMTNAEYLQKLAIDVQRETVAMTRDKEGANIILNVGSGAETAQPMFDVGKAPVKK